MINTSSVTPQYEKPRRRRQFKEMKLFEFDQKQEENLKLLEEVRNHSAKQFNYIMDVGNEISKHAKNEDLEALQEVANRNIDILHLLRMHIEETFEQVLQFRFDDILEYFLENGFNIKDINMTRGVNKQDFEYEYEQFNKYFKGDNFLQFALIALLKDIIRFPGIFYIFVGINGLSLILLAQSVINLTGNIIMKKYKRVKMPKS
ncbi:transmembrane protein, putative (macronuclear) [Tetrahymena thermophila SB210]|uniref:Transmembrane protein, putative n=1 Tax=Tetrahymena thermophila (strain SB210) TaxID=312017 RepID=I7LVV5_TETTS|nr:transmembrane protein, putative [Tetrahymena thermophila SB210]EAR99898.1 transmembrane protein, putative [Tetrahymena thermophila SB210]|eukprot:XP_001020143.1 transmembrane protein, putative [Tetrahymena thermophila SB210]